jgi:hypothetical protein
MDNNYPKKSFQNTAGTKSIFNYKYGFVPENLHEKREKSTKHIISKDN